MMTRHIVFVHGRRLSSKADNDVKKSWCNPIEGAD